YLDTSEEPDAIYLMYPARIRNLLITKVGMDQIQNEIELKTYASRAFPKEIIGGVLADAVLRVSPERIKSQFREGMTLKYQELCNILILDKLSLNSQDFDTRLQNYPVSVQNIWEEIINSESMYFTEDNSQDRVFHWEFTGQTETPFGGRIVF